MSSDKISVLFVCLGNICRSTMAEGVFQSVAGKAPYKDLIEEIDSCGTAAYHVGSPPDHRTMATLKSNGVTDYRHRGRQLQKADFDRFDYIFAMDESNLSDIRNLQRSKKGSKAQVMLWGRYAGGDRRGGRDEVVEDPYYGGTEGFDVAYEQCARFTANFLKETFPDVKAE
ncbi:unnamed protein product [Parascedosporium putredinis]|uniref:Phosphotyrosine protein phosphatase I domain-containing protein n=1 Tax=Parascedosporium putredinis TaxID=1442378 RepID=A0A9P1GWV3_9PEZI|nr:unnamed protein product [Parascedosporium putredinis]CAI7989944.1 unnamed protein product [Parascedosporium putredinis]